MAMRAARRGSAPGGRRLRAGACAAALLIVVAGEAATEQLRLEHRISHEQLVRNFDTVVFHNEFAPRTDDRLHKWVDPVRVRLDIRAGDIGMIERVTLAHVQHLAEITDHDIAFAEDGATANMIIVFERESRLDQVSADYFGAAFDITKVMQRNLCFGQYRTNGNFAIDRAVIVIPIDRVMSRGRLAACVIEETTQVLGLPNDSDSVFPSVFNDHSIDVELSRQDVLMVRALYDPRLKPGMPRAEALERVRAIFDEIDAQGRDAGATPTAGARP